MKTARIVIFCLLLGLVPSCGGDKGISHSDEALDSDPIAEDSSETGADLLDADGDGYRAGTDDCDDRDASVHPGAVETSADGVDQDCDGSDHAGERISDLSVRLDATGDSRRYGEVITIDTTADSLDPVVLISGMGGSGQDGDGGLGQVDVFTYEEMQAGAPGVVLPQDKRADEWGYATAVIRLADDSRAWVVGITNVSETGGFCVWQDDPKDSAGTAEVDACIPPFEEDAVNRAEFGFSSAADLNGDGFPDLVISGFAESARERTGAIWLTPGPLDLAALGQAPTLVLKGRDAVPGIASSGDISGDGYADLLVNDSEADSTETGVGKVFILAGGLGMPTSWDMLDGVVGDQAEAGIGFAMAGPDLDGDTQPDLCVSSISDNTAGERAGRVGCFYGPISGRHAMSEADVTWTGEEALSYFGYDMSPLDADGDGDDELAISAPSAVGSGYDWPGKVYILDPAVPTPLSLLIGDTNDMLGSALVTGDLDRDGRDDLVVGARSGAPRGAVYLVSGSSGAW